MTETLPSRDDASALRADGSSAGPAGIVIEPVSGWALASVIARKQRADDVTAKAETLFGTALPIGPKYVQTADVGFVGIAPGRWLAVSAHQPGWDFESCLREAFSDLASVSDQSDAYVLVRLSGPNARDMLAKRIAIDFHPNAFKAGDAAVTSMFLVGVTLWQLDEAPSYMLAVARSYASNVIQHLAG